MASRLVLNTLSTTAVQSVTSVHLNSDEALGDLICWAACITVGFLLDLLFIPENGDMFLRNVD
jgi:hypothetical protein